MDWSSLHKILGDTTRRSILELVKEKDAISYTEIMSTLRITNTGRLNFHIKALNGLISKDNQESTIYQRKDSLQLTCFRPSLKKFRRRFTIYR